MPEDRTDTPFRWQASQSVGVERRADSNSDLLFIVFQSVDDRRWIGNETVWLEGAAFESYARGHER